MINASDFMAPAGNMGFDFWSGVPCSFLAPLINHITDSPAVSWVPSVNEGDAVAIASGAGLAGRRGVAIMQNSGLGNAVSPLTSLNWVFGIPVLLIITLRGEPGLGDEPQHELMGSITTSMLEQMGVEWAWFPEQSEAVEPVLGAAAKHMDTTGRPFALIMRKGSVAPRDLETGLPGLALQKTPAVVSNGPGRLTSRGEVLRALIDASPEQDSVLIATTGYTGRELYAINDRPNQFYMVGSMGCASSLALGLAVARPDLQVLVADGDGAALMRMGNLAMIGANGKENLAQVILDNGMHESTGGQPTASHTVSFAAVAADCGWPHTAEMAGAQEIAPFLDRPGGPKLAHIRTAPGVMDDLPRPHLAPGEVRARLMAHIGAVSAGS